MPQWPKKVKVGTAVMALIIGLWFDNGQCEELRIPENGAAGSERSEQAAELPEGGSPDRGNGTFVPLGAYEASEMPPEILERFRGGGAHEAGCRDEDEDELHANGNCEGVPVPFDEKVP